ncbi:MAG: DNA starvation/stationary phase protection protein Dps [Dehalococcoidia bacterium]|nr:DNA starvation/stationary phase protection protein Dps [Dehalococcoidia bacterium]MCA9845724.1 DNA starvation/stationary phase protection protein Dps [Dehalococcoidia bacterium]MCA9854835.1 DNA starvation/stationary phase protection protein Dps [Dehalococcoidia bacterium]
MTATNLKTAVVTETRKAEIIGDLNTALANLIDLVVASKQAHWNIHGANFQGLHDLFDVIAAEARVYSDDVAERVLALGGTSHGTLQDAARATSLEPFPSDEKDWKVLGTALRERMNQTSVLLQNLAKDIEDDLATQDLYIEIVRGLDKRAWMIAAHLD